MVVYVPSVAEVVKGSDKSDWAWAVGLTSASALFGTRIGPKPGTGPAMMMATYLGGLAGIMVAYNRSSGRLVDARK